MASSLSWAGEINNKKFAVYLCVAIAAILAYPKTLQWFLGFIVGTGSQMAGPIGFIAMFMLPIGAALIGVPLTIVTRQRLRAMKLSGVLLLLFPVYPMLALGANPIFSVKTLGLGTMPLLYSVELWFGLAFAILMVVPDTVLNNAIVQHKLAWLRRVTACEGLMNRSEFVRFSAIVLVVYIIVSALLIQLMKIAVDQEIRTILNICQWAHEALVVFTIIAFAGPVVRRLNSRNNSFKWAVIFPGGFGILAKSFELLYYTIMESSGSLDFMSVFLMNYGYTSSVYAGAAFAVFAYLLLMKEQVPVKSPLKKSA